MSIHREDPLEMTSVDEPATCPSCGGPTAPHQETIIRLGHPDRVRLRYRCVDTGCGGSFLLAGAFARDEGSTAS